MDVLETVNLKKEYTGNLIINNVNMHIRQGEIYGLIGRNGAGKTTLMKMILGLTDITSGKIILWGNELIQGNKKTYSRIGSHLDLQGFYPELSAYENLKVLSSIRGITKKKAVESALEKVGLLKDQNKKYKKFSLGMKKRLGLASAIVHEPEFLILDEPTNGLDPIGISEFREYLLKISNENNISIMLSSHMLTEVSLMAERIGILEQGELIVEKTMNEVRAINRRALKIAVTNVQKTSSILESTWGIEDYEVLDDRHIRVFDLNLDRESFSQRLAENGIGILEISMEKDGLENYFKSLVQNAEI
ncbi:MAG: ABC transporter ATP-binding protein [Lachnospiraceae bacterium]